MEYTPEERKEQRAVEYLKSQLDLSNAEAVLAVYKQILEQDVFHTDVGLSFLRELNDIIHNDEAVDPGQVPPLPATSEADIVEQEPEEIKSTPEKKVKTKNNKTKDKHKKEPKEDKKKKRFFREKSQEENENRKSFPVLGFSIFLNVVLAIMVAIMFVLTITSDSPNIINYRSQLEDEYATWDEELNRREQELKKREAELNKQQENPVVDEQVEDTEEGLSQESTL